MPKRTPLVQDRQKKRPSPRQRRWWVPLAVLAAKLAMVIIPVVLLASVYVDALVREKFDGHKWAVPARIYARPLELFAGQPLSAQGLVSSLQMLGYKPADVVARSGQYLWDGGSRLVLKTRGFAYADQQEPSQWVQLDFDAGGVRQLADAQGKGISLVRLEPMLIGSIYPGSHEDRDPIQLDQMPPVLLAGLVAVEDRYFADHHGISLRGVARAMWTNLSAGGMVQGGSTITQQLVKNFYLTSERTLSRKVLEVWMAVLLEMHYSKKQILETYLNVVYLGQQGNRAIHGFSLASQYYFHQPLSELKLHQMALLIGLVKGPSYYDPWRHPERAVERRQVVLDVMLDQGIISASERDWAVSQPLGVGEGSAARVGVYPAFLDLVRRQLKSDYRDADLLSEGLQVFTTVDPQVQWLAERALTDGVARLGKAHKKLADGKLQGAVVVTAPSNGEVLALVGDADPKYPGFNRAVEAHRPIGSLVKPFVFLAALETNRYSMASMLDDSPYSMRNADGSYWRPKNYDHKDHGSVPLYEVLAHSYNQATARTGMQIGLKRVVEVMKRAGAESEVQALPSTLLGAVEMSPLEVAGMYQVFAADGFYLPLRAIRDVYTADGKPLKRYGLEMDQRFDNAYIQQMLFAMQAVFREGTAKPAYDQLPFGMQFAGKTGTTDDQRDSWFAGFSTNYNTVVWLGRDDNAATPLTGATGALTVWTALMKSLPNQSLGAPSHEKLQWLWIDAAGHRTDEGCAGAVRVPVDVRATQPESVSCGSRAASWLSSMFN